jgi:hypothetical protein
MTTYFPLFRRRGEANAASIPGEACPRVQEDQTEIPQSVAGVRFFLFCYHQYYGAGAESRGAEISPPGARAEITNCGSGFFLFNTDLKKFYRKK